MKSIRKSFVALLLGTTLLAGTAPVIACDGEGSVPYLNGKHSEITTVETVDYQEGSGTFYFITQGSVEFWVLDIKQEPFSQQRLDYYTKLYKGKQVQIDFTVDKGSITTISYHLVPAVPVMQPKK